MSPRAAAVKAATARPSGPSSLCRRFYVLAVVGIVGCCFELLTMFGHQYSHIVHSLSSSESIGVRMTANETMRLASHATAVRTIPKLIHQSWKMANHIPRMFVPWMQSWRLHNPFWSYMFWDDADNLHLFETHYTKYAAVARQVGKIHLADMTRYALLHHYGGVYADSDFESLKSFDDLVELDLFMSYEPLAHSVLLEGATAPVVCNAILGSTPGHPFWLHVLDNILAAFEEEGADHADPVSLTGPRMVHRTVASYNQMQPTRPVTMLAEEYFYPEVAYWNIDNLNRRCVNATDLRLQSLIVQQACAWLAQYPTGRFTNNTHAVHRWQCTWCRGDNSWYYYTLQDIFPSQVILRPKL